jgi:hypothetical protein
MYHFGAAAEMYGSGAAGLRGWPKDIRVDRGFHD